MREQARTGENRREKYEISVRLACNRATVQPLAPSRRIRQVAARLVAGASVLASYHPTGLVGHAHLVLIGKTLKTP